jgi:hypothetical protein
MKRRSLPSVDVTETEDPASDRRNGSPRIADGSCDDAAAEARRLDRPLLVLFDEVPG